MTDKKPEHNINLTEEDERILDKVWEQVAIQQGKGDAWKKGKK